MASGYGGLGTDARGRRGRTGNELPQWCRHRHHAGTGRTGAIAAEPAVPGGGALGRALGRVAGRAASRVSGEYAYEAYDVASGTARDLVDVATVPGAAAGTVTAYLVTLRFDDGSESAIRSAEAGALRVGARARVFGSGASAQIVAE